MGFEVEVSREELLHVRWSQTAWPEIVVGTEWVSDLLGIKAASFHQLITRGAFPASEEPRGRPGRWSLVAVADFVLAQRPGLVERFPRLFPRVAVPAPALFLGAYVVTVPRRMGPASGPAARDSCVVYLWQPSDGGRPVALGYPLGHERPAASLLLAALQAEFGDVSAVAVVGDDWRPRGGDSGQTVVEAPPVDYADDSAVSLPVGAVGWFELAYLLQVDLPVWPPDLVRTDRPAGAPAGMLEWQPGVAPVPMMPPLAGAMMRVAAMVPADSPVAGFSRRWAEVIAAWPCGEQCEPAEADIPAGMCRPAFPVSPTTGRALPHRGQLPAIPVLPPGETARVLHTAVPDFVYPLLRDAANSFPLWLPVVAGVVQVNVAAANPLARQWVHRLEPMAGGEDVVGYRYVRAAARESGNSASAVSHRLVDPLFPDLWIVREGDVITLTVPAAIPAAVGTLQHLDLTCGGRDAFSAWWSDSAGTVWPMPIPDHGAGYGIGYPGGGPTRLAAAACQLACDASATVGDIDPHDPLFVTLRDVVSRRRDHPTSIWKSADGWRFACD